MPEPLFADGKTGYQEDQRKAGMPVEDEISIEDRDLEEYGLRAIEGGATHAKQIAPDSVVTAPWVRLKCQFGCPGYGKSYCCPPNTPTPEQTREILDSYRRAILFHIEVPDMPEKEKHYRKFFDMLVDLEGWPGRVGSVENAQSWKAKPAISRVEPDPAWKPAELMCFKPHAITVSSLNRFGREPTPTMSIVSCWWIEGFPRACR
jgi:hypothetical protein